MIKAKGRRTMWATAQASERVRKVRKLHSMTQDAFAELLGVSVGTLRDWEQGRGDVPLLAQKFMNRLEQDLRQPAVAS